MRRGFKAACERRTTDLRRELHLRPYDPLPAQRLAKHLGVLIVEPGSIPGISDALLHQLLEVDSSGWSAVTLETAQGACIIHNPSHSPGRCESDLMHELAHLLLCHQPSLLITLPGDLFPLRTFTQEQEEEAQWFGACLQLPRAALLRAVRTGKDNTAIALEYGATNAQVVYRRQITGIDRQLIRRG